MQVHVCGVFLTVVLKACIAAPQQTQVLKMLQLRPLHERLA